MMVLFKEEAQSTSMVVVGGSLLQGGVEHRHGSADAGPLLRGGLEHRRDLVDDGSVLVRGGLEHAHGLVDGSLLRGGSKDRHGPEDGSYAERPSLRRSMASLWLGDGTR